MKGISECICSAEHGNAKSQYNLGNAYYRGENIEQDYVKAYTKAAFQGHAKAQYNLGNSYMKGEGVEMNHAKATEWYRKAAAQGHEKAKLKLKSIK